MLNLYLNLVLGFSVYLSFNITSYRFAVKCCIPHGSHIGNLQLTIFIDDLVWYFEHAIHCLIYAENVNLFKVIETLENINVYKVSHPSVLKVYAYATFQTVLEKKTAVAQIFLNKYRRSPAETFYLSMNSLHLHRMLRRGSQL